MAEKNKKSTDKTKSGKTNNKSKKSNTKQKNNNSKPQNKKGAVISISVVLVLALIVSIGVTIKSNHREKPVYYDFGKSEAQGIDVSEHNGKIDWEKVEENVDFAFIRVGYRGYGNGAIAEDKRAKTNLKNANKADLPIGAYFYSQAITPKEARQEAQFTIKKLRHYDIQLPVVIDFEYASDKDGNLAGRLFNAKTTPKENAEIINEFCDEIRQAGYMPGVYASSSVFFRDIDTKALDKDIVIWVADYNSKVTFKVNYDIWQYSKTGKLDGISSEAVDLNTWYRK